MWPFGTKKQKLSTLWGVIEGSPFYLLQKHMNICYESTQLLLPFIKAAQADEWSKAEEIRLQIIELENQADRKKNKIKMLLHKNLLMPVSRSDLLGLVNTQDNLANTTKDIVGLMVGRKMKFPDFMNERVLLYIQQALATCEQANSAINDLAQLLEAGFGLNAIRNNEQRILELHRLEKENDETQIMLRNQLFVREKELSAVDVMFLYNVIERIGDLADWSERVGANLLLLLAR